MDTQSSEKAKCHTSRLLLRPLCHSQLLPDDGVQLLARLVALVAGAAPQVPLAVLGSEVRVQARKATVLARGIMKRGGGEKVNPHNHARTFEVCPGRRPPPSPAARNIWLSDRFSIFAALSKNKTKYDFSRQRPLLLLVQANRFIGSIFPLVFSPSLAPPSADKCFPSSSSSCP